MTPFELGREAAWWDWMEVLEQSDPEPDADDRVTVKTPAEVEDWRRGYLERLAELVAADKAAAALPDTGKGEAS